MNAKIEEIEISKLKTNPVNVKTHPKEQINDLAIQIQQEPGFTNPLIIDEDYVIWVGHGRLEAVKSLGWDKVPCIMVHNMSEAEKYRYMIKDNQVNESPWEKENLQIAYDKVDPILFEPFKMDIQDIGIKLPVEEESEPIPEPPEEPKAKLGDIYELGNHRVMCGDSEHDIEKLMNGRKAQMMWADPPYGVAYEQGKFTGTDVKKKFKPIKNDEKQGEVLRDWITRIFTKIKQFTPTAPIYICSPSMTPSLMILYGLIDSGYHMQSQIIWVKNQFIMGRADYHWKHEIIWYGYESNPHYWCGDRTQDTIWEVKKDNSNSYVHPTQKPIELPRRAIENSSKANNVVLDPFLGSGSTLIACEQTNRICYGMELDPAYVDVIIERWENFTGKKAKLIESAKTEQEIIP